MFEERKVSNMKKKYGRYNNCMAYALGRKTWMVPKGWYQFAESQDYDAEWNIIENLQSMFNLKLIKREDMVLGKEYIAFRYEYDGYEIGDFHFIKRHKTGHWTHKAGGNPVKGISEKVVFADTWSLYNDYNSDLYLFEVLDN
jgi:hypothetical protein